MISFTLLLLRYSVGNLLLWPLILLSSKMRKRIKIEYRYGVQSREQVSTKIWFHVSSEGEWEQIWPLVEFLAQALPQEVITIWFTSASLKNKVDKLKEKDPQGNIQPICLSLLGFNPLSKKSILSYPAPCLFTMVRYDFFPELMFMGLRSQFFTLLWGTLKGKEKAFKRNIVKRMVAVNRYSYFNQIIAATDKDAQLFKKLLSSKNIKIEAYDFRHDQIIHRQKSKFNLEKTHFLDSFVQMIGPFAKRDRIILGNFWSHEIDLFSPELIEDLKEKKRFVFIAPHHLKGKDFDAIKNWFQGLKEEGLDTVLWDEIGIHGEGNIVLCQWPGLLCELYPFFGHCYIGNGFGRSIHSALEPFWGGGNLYCGPKVHRSTEFDFVREYFHKLNLEFPVVLKAMEDFYPVMLENREVADRQHELNQLAKGIMEKKEILLKPFLQYLPVNQG